jgi:uncharacterized LabA/DUF88 family protein
LVRFLRKQPTSTDKEATGRAPAKAPPGPPARTSAAAASAAAKVAAPVAPAEEPAEKKTRTRRAPVRPPRRDWAAEAAAAPIGEPAPAPTSLATSPATSPSEEGGDGTATPAKRRRGTRGGRGRKKPGTAATAAETPAAPAKVTPMPVLKESAKKGEPLSLEALVAHQSAVLESFASQVTASLQALQTAIAALQAGGAAATAIGQQRVGIFVDVPNLIYAAERRNINLDFGRMLDYFTRGRQLVRASAYAPISDDPQAKLESQRFVHHFVGHPYRIITKPLKRFADGSMKANFDIELAIDILTMSDRLDVVVLMSGDGDFRRLVEILSSRGVRVEIVAFSESASAELKTVADLYVDIGSHLDDFRILK